MRNQIKFYQNSYVWRKNSNAWSLSNEVCSTEKELQSQRVFNQTWIKIAKFVNKWSALCKYVFSKKPITPLRSVSETSAHWINLKPKHIHVCLLHMCKLLILKFHQASRIIYCGFYNDFSFPVFSDPTKFNIEKTK